MVRTKPVRYMWRQLMMSASHGAMNLLLMHFAEEAQRKSQQFMSFVEAHRKHTLMATLRGRPYLPVFHAAHKIKPDNWSEPPLVQS